MALSVPETKGPILNVDLPCSFTPIATAGMAHTDDSFVLWRPNGQAELEYGTMRWYSMDGMGCIAVPVLNDSTTTGENARISCFVNGASTVLEFYQGISPREDGFTLHNQLLNECLPARRIATRTIASVAAQPSEEFPVSEATIVADGGNTSDSDYDNPARTRRRLHLMGMDAMASISTSLLSDLEEAALGIIQSRRDVVVVRTYNKIRAAAILVRPGNAGGKYQLCFIFGGVNWRRRRGMHVDLLRITFPDSQSLLASQGNIVEVACTCAEFRKTRTCVHNAATYGNADNRIRILAISSRGLQAFHQEVTQNEWEAIQIPKTQRDNVELWHVFRRRVLSSSFDTSATVLVDARTSRLRKHPRERMMCVLCPGVAKNRMLCAHETATLGLMAAGTGGIEAEDALSTTENIPQDSHWEIVMDELDSGSDDMEPEATINGPRAGNDATRIDAICFTSKRPRFFFPCTSDESALREFLLIVSESRAGEGRRQFIGRDDVAICSRCGLDARSFDNPTVRHRGVTVTTLHHGSIDILVTDYVCTCGAYIPYDGYANSFFCLTKKHVFTRELLDAWLWDLCGSGGTFRDTFSSWASKGLASSASFHRLGREVEINRQRGNEAFSAFLKTLKFPRDEDLYALFSCPKCERNPQSGSRELDAVVMDGTALGILGTLPEFIRETRLVSPVPRVPDKQYIMPTPKYRAFVDAILTSAKGAGALERFNVPVKNSLWKNKEDIISHLFNYHGGIHHETFAVAKFMNACFGFITDVETSQGFRFRHKLQGIDVRRTIVEFGRCFAVGSIAGGVLRNTISVAAASDIHDALRQFSSCNHYQSQATLLSIPVCEPCAKRLLQSGRRSDEKVAPAARFASAIANAAILGEGNELRSTALAAADILRLAIDTRKRYLDLFVENQGEDVRSYNSAHRYGYGLEESPEEDWLTEAQRTGEFFPGRPQVRPRMDFGRSSKKENARSCRKLYTKSESHSPGIFTVQCVCSHPKLIGISVMSECEGVSTALSVLLSRFRKLPRVCYYDNACNMARSIVLRCPWVNDDCTVVCDRFHYHGHTCNSVWDPSNYSSCEMHATSGAEAMNHIWNFSKSHLRFLRPDNMIPFLATRAVFVNIRACIRENSGKVDINPKQFRDFVRNRWDCSCSRCNM